jgi:hypothetical protein
VDKVPGESRPPIPARELDDLLGGDTRRALRVRLIVQPGFVM